MTHEVFTIVAAVRSDSGDRLRRLLKIISDNPDANALLPFGRLTMLHFASFVVFHEPVQGPVQDDDEQPPPVLPDQLVFESCIDGPFDEYANALLHVGGAALHRIFSCCADYGMSTRSDDDPGAPAESLTEDQRHALKDYLRKRYRQPNLLHIGSPGLRVDHIKAGARLRKHLDHELDAVVARGRATERPLELMQWLRDRLNVPPSSRSHWFLAEPSPKEVESKRFPWFASSSRTSHRVCASGESCSALWRWPWLVPGSFLLTSGGSMARAACCSQLLP